MKSIVFSMAVLLFVLISCKQSEKTKQDIGNNSARFIQPPVPGVDVPISEYIVKAEKGDTIFHETGSIIFFPANSFVDRGGKIISGDVRVTYREFADPVDFYLSGIPMNYDSAGKEYSFESFGMCEILAYEGSVPVYVNPESKPIINLVNNNNVTAGNLYFLDTIQQKWINKKNYATINLDLISNKEDAKPKQKIAAKEYKVDLDKPLKPVQAKKGAIIIKIVIDPASFKELLVYDNMKFEIDPGNTNFNPKDTEVEWSGIDLQKGHKEGLYKIKFSKKDQSVTYAVRPVLEGEDYNRAIKIFEEKTREYNAKLNERITREERTKKQIALQLTRDSLESQRILAENQRIRELNKLIEERNKEILKINVERKKTIDKQAMEMHDAFALGNTVRRFSIDVFGVWNCDEPIMLNSFPVVANFQHRNGDTIELQSTAVVMKSINGIASYYGNVIRLSNDSDNMIFGVYGGRFAYITFKEYNALKITKDTKEQTFIMSIVSKEQNNYEFIKKLGIAN